MSSPDGEAYPVDTVSRAAHKRFSTDPLGRSSRKAEPALAQSHDHGADPRMSAQLGLGVLQVCLHPPRRDPQRCGNYVRRLVASDATQHLLGRQALRLRGRRSRIAIGSSKRLENICDLLLSLPPARCRCTSTVSCPNITQLVGFMSRAQYKPHEYRAQLGISLVFWPGKSLEDERVTGYDLQRHGLYMERREALWSGPGADDN